MEDGGEDMEDMGEGESTEEEDDEELSHNQFPLDEEFNMNMENLMG